MKRWKGYATTFLVAILVLAPAGVACAQILKQASQLINLVSPSPNTGSFAFSALKVRQPDGSLSDFILPDDKVLVVTKFTGNFTATDTTLNNKVQLNLSNFFRASGQLASGVTGFIDSMIPGVPITAVGENIFVCTQNDPNYTPIPGTLNLRIVGYLAPKN